MSDTSPQRRFFLLSAAAALGSLSLPKMALSAPAPASMATRQLEAGLLDVGLHEAGPENGRPVILLHGLRHDLHSYAEAAPLLAAQGLHVIVPHLRGHGSTRFLDPATPGSSEPMALGQDVIDLMDALHIPEAVLAGFGLGGTAASAAAALRPTRAVGVLSTNGDLIKDSPRSFALAVAELARKGKWRT